MAIPNESCPAVAKAERQIRRWTKAESNRLGELGFVDGQKVELIEGEIIVQYPEPGMNGLAYSTTEPQSRLWPKEEYHHLCEAGFFSGEKLQLLEGAIVVETVT